MDDLFVVHCDQIGPLRECRLIEDRTDIAMPNAMQTNNANKPPVVSSILKDRNKQTHQQLDPNIPKSSILQMENGPGIVVIDANDIHESTKDQEVIVLPPDLCSVLTNGNQKWPEGAGAMAEALNSAGEDMAKFSVDNGTMKRNKSVNPLDHLGGSTLRGKNKKKRKYFSVLCYFFSYLRYHINGSFPENLTEIKLNGSCLFGSLSHNDLNDKFSCPKCTHAAHDTNIWLRSFGGSKKSNYNPFLFGELI